jgi:serine/threonine protein kinase
LHGIGIIHTDLKPENILLKKEGRFHKCKDRKNYTKYYIPRDTDIKLIDFGNAVVADEEDVVYTSTINTRQFRAPEVTLSKYFLPYPKKNLVNGMVRVTCGVSDASFWSLSPGTCSLPRMTPTSMLQWLKKSVV